MGKWVAWAETKDEVTVIPADPFYVAIYLNHLLHTNGTVGAINTAVYGINWAHHAAGFESPTDDPFVQLITKGSRKICGKPSVKKDPLTAPLIRYLVDLYKPASGPPPNLKNFPIFITRSYSVSQVFSGSRSFSRRSYPT